MVTNKLAKIAIASVGITVLVGTWFFYGEPLSEETSYRLALDEAQKEAVLAGVDLDDYAAPEIGSQSGRRTYSFKWVPKDPHGKSLTIIVDALLVNTAVVASPAFRTSVTPHLGLRARLGTTCSSRHSRGSGNPGLEFGL